MRWILALVVGVAIYIGYCCLDTFDPECVRGKRVLVTGASTGIGEQLAYHYARLRASVVITARTESKLQQTAAEKMGGLDILVLNHIRPYKMKTWEDSAKDLDHLTKLMDVNFFSYVHLASHAMPYLDKSRDGGSIVVVSSSAGVKSMPFHIEYSTSKFALGGFFDGLRQQLVIKGSNTSITLCFLGYIGTEAAKQVVTTYKLKTGEPEDPSETALLILKAGVNRAPTLYHPYIILKLIETLAVLSQKTLDQMMAFYANVPWASVSEPT